MQDAITYQKHLKSTSKEKVFQGSVYPYSKLECMECIVGGGGVNGGPHVAW